MAYEWVALTVAEVVDSLVASTVEQLVEMKVE